jgi:hypothetical protein
MVAVPAPLNPGVYDSWYCDSVKPDVGYGSRPNPFNCTDKTKVGTFWAWPVFLGPT